MAGSTPPPGDAAGLLLWRKMKHAEFWYLRYQLLCPTRSVGEHSFLLSLYLSPPLFSAFQCGVKNGPVAWRFANRSVLSIKAGGDTRINSRATCRHSP